MVDPSSCVIQGDISREDALVLVSECSGRSVVEFGTGGSTLILARCASSLASYDTDRRWLDGTAKRLAQMDGWLKTCEPSLIHSADVPVDINECDVLWVDGLSGQRTEWCVLHFPRCRTLLLHDSRRAGAWSTVGALLAKRGLEVDSVHMHAGAWSSNIVVVRRRFTPVAYVSWWDTEKGDKRRVWPKHDSDWVPEPVDRMEP